MDDITNCKETKKIMLLQFINLMKETFLFLIRQSYSYNIDILRQDFEQTYAVTSNKNTKYHVTGNCISILPLPHP